jgi:putative endonuclease
MKKQLTGDRAEQIAATFFEAKGWTLLAQNWRYGQKEVDLILRDGHVIVFAEVKARRQVRFGHPEEFVDARKQANMVAVASAWMEQHAWEGEIRFDIVSILNQPGQPPFITHFPDAFFPFHEDGPG